MTEETSIDRGKREFLAIAITSGVLVMTICVFTWRANPHYPSVRYLATGVGLVSLIRFGYRGHRWARAALAIWVGLIAVFIAINALGGFVYRPTLASVLLVTAGGWGLAALRLLTSPHISGFVDAQRRGASLGN